MKRTAGNKQNIVGLDVAVLGVDGASLDNRQNIALYALARYIGTVAIGFACNLVHFVDKNHTVVFSAAKSFAFNAVKIDKFFALFRCKDFECFGNRDSTLFCLFRQHIAENASEIYLACTRLQFHGFGNVRNLNFDVHLVKVMFSDFVFKRGFVDTFGQVGACFH